MKKIVVTSFFCIAVLLAFAQDKNAPQILMIGDPAPEFTAETTNGKLTFPADFGENWKIIFSHPRDFTPVCSSELLELRKMQKDFDALNVKILVVSTDTKERHAMWKHALEEIDPVGSNDRSIRFPLVDDNSMTVSKMYGMLHNKVSTTESVRGVYVIDPQNKIQATFFYPMNIGRNMAEILRSVEALQTASQQKLYTPANWSKGGDLLVPYFPYTDNELAQNPGIADQYYQVGSMLWYKKSVK